MLGSTHQELVRNYNLLVHAHNALVAKFDQLKIERNAAINAQIGTEKYMEAFANFIVNEPPPSDTKDFKKQEAFIASGAAAVEAANAFMKPAPPLVVNPEAVKKKDDSAAAMTSAKPEKLATETVKKEEEGAELKSDAVEKRKHQKVFSSAAEEQQFKQDVGDFIKDHLVACLDESFKRFVPAAEVKENFNKLHQYKGGKAPSDGVVFKELKRQILEKFPDVIDKKVKGISGYEGILPV